MNTPSDQGPPSLTSSVAPARTKRTTTNQASTRSTTRRVSRMTQAPVACRTHTFGSTYVATPCSTSHQTGVSALGTSTGPVAVEGQAGPLAPLLEGAGDDHRARARPCRCGRRRGRGRGARGRRGGRRRGRGRRRTDIGSWTSALPLGRTGATSSAKPWRRGVVAHRGEHLRREAGALAVGADGDLDGGDRVGLARRGGWPAGRCGSTKSQPLSGSSSPSSTNGIEWARATTSPARPARRGRSRRSASRRCRRTGRRSGRGA